MKKNPPTTQTPVDTGPPLLDVHWNGHPSLPPEVNDAEILKDIMMKVAEYKRYEYCPFGNVDDCDRKSVNDVVDKIIDVVLHPTEPPTEAPTTENPADDETAEANNAEEEENEGTEETEVTGGDEKTTGTEEQTTLNEEEETVSTLEPTEAPGD